MGIAVSCVTCVTPQRDKHHGVSERGFATIFFTVQTSIFQRGIPMNQNIDQLAEEMTNFCDKDLVIKESLPVEIKNRFIQNPQQFLKERWNSVVLQHSSTVALLVTISLLVGGTDGGWCGGRWLREY